MNTPHPLFDPAEEDQAALWAARLDGSELSAADRSTLEAWLAEKPERRALLGDYHALSTALDRQLPALVRGGAIALPEPAPRTARRSWGLWALAASLTATAAAVAMFWAVRPGASQRIEYTAPVAQRQALTLVDGTHVEMFAQTHLSIAIDHRRRHVALADGEAFFAVAKDVARPFTVQTPAGSVQVTGTRFDVRSEGQDVLEVTVAEGSVLVRPQQGGATTPVTLVPGSQLRVNAGQVSVSTLSPAALNNALAWRSGQVIFEGTPLREAVASFARYHGRNITIAADAASLRVGGRYSLDDLGGFFAALEEVLPVRVTHDPAGGSQVSLRPQG